MKTIRVFEAFAGYGSQALALKRLEAAYPDKVHFEFVGISEIEPNAIKAYRALHGEDVPNFGDITKINWGGYLTFSCLRIVFRVPIFPRPDCKGASMRAAAHVLPYFGNVNVLLSRNSLSTCLWRMSRRSHRKSFCHFLISGSDCLRLTVIQIIGEYSTPPILAYLRTASACLPSVFTANTSRLYSPMADRLK